MCLFLFPEGGAVIIITWAPNASSWRGACDLEKRSRAHRARWAAFIGFGAWGILRLQSPVFLWAVLLS